MVFNIQRYTVHDGPGIRTEVFLKGCPLSCKWCSNPEGQNIANEIGLFPKNCIGISVCGVCIKSCPVSGCVIYDRNGLVIGIDRDNCLACGRCAYACPSNALKLWGSRMTTDDILAILHKDMEFYKESGGGVTISGGEPLLQIDFLEEILKKCKFSGINTCVESTLYSKWESIERILNLTDIIISDIKVMDEQQHHKYTGVSNSMILENLIRLSKTHKHIILRIPLIPGVNDDNENINLTADFINNRMAGNVDRLQILEFMNLGEEKSRSIGKEYYMGRANIDRNHLHARAEEISSRFCSMGIKCSIGAKL